MKTFYKIFLSSLLLGGMLNTVNAQRSRSFDDRGSGNSRSYSRSSSPPRETITRSAPERTFGNRNESSVRNENSRPQRQMTMRQTPQRNVYNNDRITPSRPTQNQRVTASRNDNFRYDRNREITRNSYNYRNYNSSYGNHYYGNHYYGNVYGRRTWFMNGTRYRAIPHSFISIRFGGNPYYYNNGFYYGYYGGYYQPIFPPFGLQIGVLPFGYSRLFIGGFPYYYYNGIYYQQYENSYQVVDAPMGATVSALPEGARSVVINGENLYELNGTYYKADRDENGNNIFVVVGKNGIINNTSQDESNMAPNASNLQTPDIQIGDELSQLPEGSKIVTVNGQQVYETPDNVYLQEESNNGVVQYKVVGK
ncbi:MAG: DUF6515 family protein [Ginsengibacter sp.]